MLKSKRRQFGSIRVKAPMAYPGETIGLMGGTFNPPHDGHVTVSRTAMRRLGLDRLWWVVTPGNPLKSNDELPDLESRMAACRRLLRDPKVVITAFEAQLGTPYTAATLEFLKLRYPAVRFVWVMGADNLAGFHRWQRWRDIAKMMPMAVVDRPGWRWRAQTSPTARRFRTLQSPESRAKILATGSGRGWTLLTTRLSPLSSTELRRGAATAPTPDRACDSILKTDI